MLLGMEQPGTGYWEWSSLRQVTGDDNSLRQVTGDDNSLRQVTGDGAAWDRLLGMEQPGTGYWGWSSLIQVTGDGAAWDRLLGMEQFGTVWCLEGDRLLDMDVLYCENRERVTGGGEF